MSACLTALPPEILSCVVANIASPSTLCNLARCSRQLHVCTIPHLYRDVTIHEICRRPERQDERVRTLASLLIQRPDLALLVRGFTLRVTDHPSERVYGVEKFREPAESAEPEDRVRHESVVDQAFVTAANASSLSKEEKINHLGQFRPTHQYYYGFILALLLPALLKVEKVVLDWGTDFDTYYLEEMMARAARREKPFHTQPPFEALTVFVYSHDRFNIPSSDFIALLLRFPAIQKISGRFETLWNHEADRLHKPDSLRYRPSHGDLQDLDSSSSPLTSLNLTVCGLTTTDLGHILRAPKALKTFCYKFCHRHCVDITTDKIRHVLEPQQDCLERIELNCESKRGTDGGNIGSMTSFINFNTLEVLKAPAFFFAATEDINGSERHSLIGIFPHSLKRLHVTRFRGRLNGLVESLEHLLARKSPQQIPLLQKLLLEEAYSFDAKPTKLRDVLWRDTQEIAIERLGRVAAIQGVSLDVTEESIVTSPKGVRATIARSEEKRQEEFVQGFLELDE